MEIKKLMIKINKLKGEYGEIVRFGEIEIHISPEIKRDKITLEIIHFYEIHILWPEESGRIKGRTLTQVIEFNKNLSKAIEYAKLLETQQTKHKIPLIYCNS